MHIEFVRPSFLCVALILSLWGCNDEGKRETDSIADEADGCMAGELGCECNAGQCLGNLECVGGMCVSGCVPGELGCECNAGQCLGGLECVGNLCSDPNCTPGELACECNDGQCLGDLECVGNVCLEGSGTGDGDTTGADTTGDGDGDGCGVGEMLCNGSCTDVMTDDLNCGTCGNTCPVTNQSGGCQGGDCAPAFSECIPLMNPPKDCTEVCADLDKMCAEDLCEGTTLLEYGTLDACEDFAGGAGTNLKCDGLPIGTYYRCCCDD